VGFAAETHDAVVNARAKLARKGLDMIVLNDVSDQRIGFDSDNNAVTVITVDSEERIDIGSKTEIARALIARIATALERPATHQRKRHTKRSAESDTAAG
ncbi:MAG TPA: phosphopantothenoylcysteine decarboxylase, partial [Pseudomonadales bacterium]